MGRSRTITYELKLGNLVHLLYGLDNGILAKGVLIQPILTHPLLGTHPDEFHVCDTHFLDIHFGDVFYKLGVKHPGLASNRSQLLADIYGRPQNKPQHKSSWATYSDLFIDLVASADILTNGNNAIIDSIYNTIHSILSKWDLTMFYDSVVQYVDQIPSAEANEINEAIDPIDLSSLLNIVRKSLSSKNIEGYSIALTWLLIGAFLRTKTGILIRKCNPMAYQEIKLISSENSEQNEVSIERFDYLSCLIGKAANKKNIYVSPAESNIWIIGASGYGETNLLLLIYYNLIKNYSSEEINFYILDFNSRRFSTLMTSSHVGGVISEDSLDSLSFFIKMVKEEITDRRKYLSEANYSSYSAYIKRHEKNNTLPLWIVMIDGYTKFQSLYSEVYSDLDNILSECISVGICFIVSSNSLSGYRYSNFFGTKIAFYCNDAYIYNDFLGKQNTLPDAVPGSIIIKNCSGITKGTIFLAESMKNKSITEYTDNTNIKKIPIMPTILTREFLEHINFIETYGYACVGVEYGTYEPIQIQFNQFNLITISGFSGSGKSNFETLLINQLLKLGYRDYIFICDKKCNDHRIYNNVCNFFESVSEVKQLLKFLANKVIENPEFPAYIFIEDSQIIRELCKDADMMNDFNLIRKNAHHITIIFNNFPNRLISYSDPSIYRILSRESRFFFFDQIHNLKCKDISPRFNRRYDHNARTGLAYVIEDDKCKRVRIILEDVDYTRKIINSCVDEGPLIDKAFIAPVEPIDVSKGSKPIIGTTSSGKTAYLDYWIYPKREHSMIVFNFNNNKTYYFDQTQILIGRSQAADLFIEDLYASEKHAMLFQNESGSFYITDLMTANGIWIEGKRIPPMQQIQLHKGEEFVIGTTKLELL